MASKAKPRVPQPGSEQAKRWSKSVAGYREKFVDLLVLALPTAVTTRICDQISGSFLKQPWQALYLLVPLAVVAWLIWQQLKARKEFQISRRFILFLFFYIVAFSVAAATRFLDWNRKITVFGEAAPRNWLAPARFGDWRYALLQKHSASSHGLIIVTMPPAGGQSVESARNDVIRLVAWAEHARAQGVALDFYFNKASALDTLFCQVIGQAKIPIITGYSFDRVNGQAIPTALPESLAGCIPTEGVGHLGGFRDSDHRVRFIPMHYQNRAAFSLVVASKIASLEGRKEVIVPDDEMLRFVDPEPAIPTVSYQQLETSRVDISERFVLVGSDREMVETPFGQELGIAIHAGAIHSLLGHHYIRGSPWWLSFGIILGSCYFLTWLAGQGLSALRLIGFCSLISVIVVSCSAISIVVGPLWLDVAYPLIAIWLLLMLLLPFRLIERRLSDG